MTSRKTSLVCGIIVGLNHKFECRFGPSGDIEIGRGVRSDVTGWEFFSLRRLHSNHPTNCKFLVMIVT